MNKKTIKFTTDFLAYMMIVGAIYSVLITIILFLDTSNQMLVNTALVMIVPFVQYFIKFIRSAIVFAFTHFVVLGICSIIIINGTFGIMESLLYSIIWIALFIIFFSLRKTEDGHRIESCSAAPIVVIICANFFAGSRATDMYDKVISIILICMILVYFINLYIANTYIFFEGNILSGVMNYKKSMRFSTKLMTSFVIGCALIMSGSLFIPSMGLVDKFKHIMFLFTKWFVGLFTANPTNQSIATPSPTVAPQPTVPISDLITETTAPKDVDVDKYMNFIYIPLAVLAIIIVVVSIFAGLKTIQKKDEDEQRFFISPFTKDEETKVSSQDDKKKESFYSRIISRNPNRRIRRSFEKAISCNVNLGENIKSSFTPTQLCELTTIRKKTKKTTWDFNNDTTTSTNDDELECLKHLYEKARYSNTSCTKEEADKASLLQKSL